MEVRHSAEALRRFGERCFVAAGMDREGAAIVTDVLVHAEERGHASHGITRVPITVKRLRTGVMKPRPDVKIEQVAPGMALVDADNGPGPIASVRALDAAVAMAKTQGVGVAVVAHSNHNGAGSYYAERALKQGCIALCTTNAPPSMAVHGGRTPVIGTNPVTMGVPGGDVSLLMDMATSVVARGKIVEASKRKEAIPQGWALDRDGRPTTDAVAAEKGVVLPLAGAKGSALAIMVEVLSGVLGGGRFAGDLGNLYQDFETPQDIGHFFLALKPPGEGFEARVGTLVGQLRQSALQEGVAEILMPGEPETRRRAQSLAEGIDLPDNVARDLDAVADLLGVARLA
ncbi:MAG: Ldh family oxidoreductase [Rhodospirillales bacterium]|nr:Ldh family oxidoreductase [Rhodospirillales bacterium]